MNTKEQLINQLIKTNNYKSYLEIGTQFGVCMNEILCENKTGVDPKKLIHSKVSIDHFFNMTSDEFFGQNEDTFDIIFIDGLHHATQVLADIVNAAAILNDNGTIVVHDLLPDSELHQEVPRRSRKWYGDCWKAWYVINKGGYDVITETNDFDCGVGVLSLGDEGLEQLLIDYNDNLHRIELLTYQNDFSKYLELINKGL